MQSIINRPAPSQRALTERALSRSSLPGPAAGPNDSKPLSTHSARQRAGMKAIPWIKSLSARLLLALIVVLCASATPASAGGLAPDLDREVQRHPNSGKTVRV